MKLGRLVAFTFALGVTGTSLASANSPRSDFWERRGDPSRARARTLSSQALELLAEARGNALTAWVSVASAIRRLERAVQLRPDDADLQLTLAIALSEYERRTPEGARQRRDADALRVLESLREQHPEFARVDVASTAAIVRTRLHDFAGAAREYQLAAADPSWRATASSLSNLAEVTMLAGAVGEAVETYRTAIALATIQDDPGSLALARFGLGLALDRLGEPDEALTRIAEAVATTPLGAGLLREDGVFFEPEHELHYYDGLVALAAARTAPDDDSRTRERERARQAFLRYVARAELNDPFVERARAHLTELAQPVASATRRRGER